jgi:hypothetical protein
VREGGSGFQRQGEHRTCAIPAHAADVALDVSAAVVAGRLLAAAVLPRHRTALDATAAAGYALDAAAIHAESILVTGQADTLKGCGAAYGRQQTAPKPTAMVVSATTYCMQ